MDSGWIQGGFIWMAFLEQQGRGVGEKHLGSGLRDLVHVTLVKWIYCMGALRNFVKVLFPTLTYKNLSQAEFEKTSQDEFA